MVRYSSYTRITQTTFSCVLWYKNKMPIVMLKKIWAWAGYPRACLLFTVYPNKYAHGFVVLCFVVVMQSFIMNSHEVFIHIHQGCFAGTGAIVRLPQCQWSKPGGYGTISQCITTTKHSKAKTVCIFLGIYCTPEVGVLPIGETIRVKYKNRISFIKYKWMCKFFFNISRTLWALQYPPQLIAFIGFQVWAWVWSVGIFLCCSVIFCSLMVFSFIFGWIFRKCPMILCLQKYIWNDYNIFYLHLR